MTTMRAVGIDLETRSPVDLLKRGVYVYAQHPETDVLLAAYKFEDELLVKQWRRGEPCPADLRDHVLAGGEIRAFNAAFERLMWWNVLTPRHGWPKPRLEQFRCTAVTAAAMALPRSLDALGAALGLSTQKDKEGKKLIAIHSVPIGFAPNGAPVWHPLADDPEYLDRFMEYCVIDVLTEEEAAKRLIPLSDQEMAIYHLNERINDRGLRIDVPSAKGALKLAKEEKRILDAELNALTDGRVSNITKIAALTEWVLDQGVEVQHLDKGAIDDLMEVSDTLPKDVKRALELRYEGAKPSVEKIRSMLLRANDDGRVRGVYLCHGAGQTGRFASRGAQLHNMPRSRKIYEMAHADLDLLFSLIQNGNLWLIKEIYGVELSLPLQLLSDLVRSFIVAAPGHKLIDVDYSSIEGRVAAWVAKEQWKVEAFEALDRGEGYGIYEMAAAGIYNVSPEQVDKEKRSTGKVAELSCQYQTGVGGIRRFASTSRIKLDLIFPVLWQAADETTRDYVNERMQSRIDAHDESIKALGHGGWRAAELIKIGWRNKHPAICRAWHSLEDAAREAVLDPGRVVTVDGVRDTRFVLRHGFLFMRLPSGRCLSYPSPKIQDVEAPWADKTLPRDKRERQSAITVCGVGAAEKWMRFSIYGGSLFNNLVQGLARDILTNGMLNLERHGYPIVLHTHDECACELPLNVGSVEEMARIMCELPGWAKGLPIAADGYVSKRYRKG